MNESRLRYLWLGSSVTLVTLLLVVVARDRGWWTLLETAPTSRVGIDATAPSAAAHAPATIAGPLEKQPAPPKLTKEDKRLERLRSRLQREGAIPKQAVIKFKSAKALQEFLRRAAGRKITILGRLDALSAVRVAYNGLEQLRDALGADAELYEGVDGNYVVKVPDFLQQEDRPSGAGSASFEGLDFFAAIDATGDRSTWGLGVTVAVVDTGVFDHMTFGENQITHYDLVNDGQPFNGHGTAMASLIAGQDSQAPGVAPASHILDVRVADSQGYSDTFTLAAGIVQAANAGALVINVSLGSYGDSQAVRDAVAYAESRGAVVVAAAGNDHTSNQISFPAAISSVISVGSVDAKLQQAYYSNSGQGLDVSAPGVGIQSAYGADMLVIGDGTSQATAIASGVLAYAISRGVPPGDSAAAWLQQSAQPLSQSADRVGAGLVQAQSK
ncbi:MAG: S8 family serine peptidase [Verrucomicrobia bacterium]|nr:S8 family serine peptidase [Verrucomicrobiota bacterium]